MSLEDKKQFIEFVLENYMADMRLATWLGDHLFGKPSQAITGPEGGPIELKIEGVEVKIRK